ncbi:ABC transporter permease subunit [Sanguibacter antarcticus]|uniref:Carbohydrate ABC transporter membrane protein 1 (CUT1 family) n=1 Tax=Sanguibacter antarcticus TaxID=372484 RepID=A0A2A9E3D7_9MICO|nr:ABC transporter permease subunit [Sanguibacter antarcticus]PFG32875.1 carbohydrate ABC transporter membrane protein 1 (CUT1 family) [Sanguibacter antarcticus]
MRRSPSAGGRPTTVRLGGARLVAPSVAVVVVVTGTALGAVLATSIGLVPLVGQPRLSLDGFTTVAGDLRAATQESLLTAAAATVLSATMGLAIATLVLRSGTRARLVVGLAVGVLTVPHLVGATTTGLLLSDVGLAQRWLGIPPASWPELVGGRWPWATVLELAWKESAFVALVVVASTGRRYSDLREVAAVLGAPPRAQWRRVLLPLAAPALASSSLIVFVYSLGTYEVARLLGRAHPEPLPVMAYRLFTDIDVAARPQAAAVAVVATAIALLAVAAALPLLRRLGAER